MILMILSKRNFRTPLRSGFFLKSLHICISFFNIFRFWFFAQIISKSLTYYNIYTMKLSYYRIIKRFFHSKSIKLLQVFDHLDLYLSTNSFNYENKLKINKYRPIRIEQLKSDRTILKSNLCNKLVIDSRLFGLDFTCFMYLK